MHVHTAVTAAQRAAAAKAGEIGGSLVTARRHCEALEEEVCEPRHRRRRCGAVAIRAERALYLQRSSKTECASRRANAHT